jgi:hypothetical protein
MTMLLLTLSAAACAVGASAALVACAVGTTTLGAARKLS